MTLKIDVDLDGLAQVCRSRGVRRLRVFGSVRTDRFNQSSSDIDLLVEFESGTADLFDAYFGLKEDLERLLDRTVDLVMADAVRNPFFEAEAVGTAEELYAA